MVQLNEFNKGILDNRIDTMFMNFKNSKTSYLYRLLLNLSNKINLNRSDKNIALSNLSIYYTQKNIKKSYKTINLKYQLQHGAT